MRAGNYAEGLGGDFQTWRGLFALVFVLIHAQSYTTDEVKRESVMVCNFLGAAKILNIGLEDTVQDIIVRQGVGILLIGPQFGGRRLGEGLVRNQFPFVVHKFRELVDHGLGHVGNHRQAAGHVPVKRAISDGRLGFIPRA